MIFSSAHFQVTTHLTFFHFFNINLEWIQKPIHSTLFLIFTFLSPFDSISFRKLYSVSKSYICFVMYVHFRKYFTLLHCLLHVVVQVSWLIWIQIRFDFYAWWFRQQYINLVAFHGCWGVVMMILSGDVDSIEFWWVYDMLSMSRAKMTIVKWFGHSTFVLATQVSSQDMSARIWLLFDHCSSKLGLWKLTHTKILDRFLLSHTQS